MDCIRKARLILGAAILDLEEMLDECFMDSVRIVATGIRNNPEEVKEVILFGPCKLFDERPGYDFLTAFRVLLTGVNIRWLDIPEGLDNGQMIKFCDGYRKDSYGRRLEGVYSVYLDNESLYSISGLTGRYKDVKDLEKRNGYFG